MTDFYLSFKQVCFPWPVFLFPGSQVKFIKTPI